MHFLDIQKSFISYEIKSIIEFDKQKQKTKKMYTIEDA